MIRRPPRSTLFPLHDALPISNTPLIVNILTRSFRSSDNQNGEVFLLNGKNADSQLDRKSTRLNSSHLGISYAVFCLKKKKHSPMNQKRYSPVFNFYPPQKPCI